MTRRLLVFDAAVRRRTAALRRSARRDPWDAERVAERTGEIRLRLRSGDLPVFVRPRKASAPPRARRKASAPPVRLTPERSRGEYVRGGRLDALSRLTGAGR